MTASRVARGMEGVRESTRKNVLEVMKKLGYQPNRLARALRNNHSNTIGIVVADVKNSFYMQVNALIEQRLRAKGFSVLVSFSNEDMEMEMSGLSMLWGARVDGIIITPVHRNDTQVSVFSRIMISRCYSCIVTFMIRLIVCPLTTDMASNWRHVVCWKKGIAESCC